MRKLILLLILVLPIQLMAAVFGNIRGGEMLFQTGFSSLTFSGIGSGTVISPAKLEVTESGTGFSAENIYEVKSRQSSQNLFQFGLEVAEFDQEAGSRLIVNFRTDSSLDYFHSNIDGLRFWRVSGRHDREPAVSL